MSYKLEEILDEAAEDVAVLGIPLADSYVNLVAETLSDKLKVKVSAEQRNITFKIFAFLMWACTYGVWSNLRDENIRDGLLHTTWDKLITAASYQTSSSKEANDVVENINMLCQEFERLRNRFIRELLELIEEGHREDVDTIMLVGFRWLQEEYELSDADMAIVTTSFFRDERYDQTIGSVEQYAFQFVAIEQGEVDIGG